MGDLDAIIREVQVRYSEGCPNGILLRWDIDRFYQDLLKIFSDYKVSNETDFNYSYCNSYDVFLRKDEKSRSWVLTIKASFIYDAFTLHITRYKSSRGGDVVPLHQCAEFASAITRARSFFSAKGFREINASEMGIEIKGVNLELAKVATVGKCLFDDFE